jgi:hypothetical protein
MSPRAACLPVGQIDRTRPTTSLLGADTRDESGESATVDVSFLIVETSRLG